MKLIAELANLEQGRSAFVMGNGISAMFYDTEKLKQNGVLIGCNRGWEIDPLDYLIWQDTGVTNSCIKFSGIKCAPIKRKKQTEIPKDTTYFYNYGHGLDKINSLAHGHTGVHALCLAVLLGCDPILLVGCDCRLFRINGEWRSNRCKDKQAERMKYNKSILKPYNGLYTTALLYGFAKKWNNIYHKMRERANIYHLGPWNISNIPSIEFEEFITDMHPRRNRNVRDR